MPNKEIGEMTFWDHLTELFNRFRRILYAFIISTIVVMAVPVSIDFENIGLSNPFYQTIASIIIKNLRERFLAENVLLIPVSFFAPLEIYVFISIIVGSIISLPVASYELYKFFNPALHSHERSFAMKFIASFVGLFTFGFALGYVYVVPLTFRTMLLFSNLTNISPIYDFAEFFSMVGMILLVCGLIFTFPIYVYILVRAGILKTQYLTENRKYLYGLTLIAIAVIDPDPSLVTETVTIIPFIILMEITIIILKRTLKNKEKLSLKKKPKFLQRFKRKSLN